MAEMKVARNLALAHGEDDLDETSHSGGRLAVAQGMRTMLREAMALVENDVTTIPEVVKTLFAS